MFVTENHFMKQSKFIDSANILMDYVYFKEIKHTYYKLPNRFQIAIKFK